MDSPELGRIDFISNTELPVSKKNRFRLGICEFGYLSSCNSGNNGRNLQDSNIIQYEIRPTVIALFFEFRFCFCPAEIIFRW